MKKLLLMLMGSILFSMQWVHAAPYDYPFTNPYEATVIGTPGIYAPHLPKEIRAETRTLAVFPEREIPDVFGYHDKLKYTLVKQKGKAPLVFIIAGTGAAHDSPKMRLMQKAFFNAGFHSISLSSPTHPNFIVTASSTMVPGDLSRDAADLYRVMGMAWDRVKDRVQASGFHLTGYSLGGAQSAFVSRLDEEKKRFNFKRVLMNNPPVSLFSSVKILDRMLEENVPGGIEHVDDFLDRVIEDLAGVYELSDPIDFGADFLYRAYKKLTPKEQDLAALIGIDFRISAANMIFTADVMSGAGLVVPKNRVLSRTDSLTDYFIITHRIDFMGYFDELFLPYYRQKEPGLTREALIFRSSLSSIEDYLMRSQKIGMVTNDDDIILEEGAVDFFDRVFKGRARLFPNGGHCGNMGHSENISHMVQFFKE